MDIKISSCFGFVDNIQYIFSVEVVLSGRQAARTLYRVSPEEEKTITNPEVCMDSYTNSLVVAKLSKINITFVEIGKTCELSRNRWECS